MDNKSHPHKQHVIALVCMQASDCMQNNVLRRCHGLPGRQTHQVLRRHACADSTHFVTATNGAPGVTAVKGKRVTSS